MHYLSHSLTLTLRKYMTNKMLNLIEKLNNKITKCLIPNVQNNAETRDANYISETVFTTENCQKSFRFRLIRSTRKITIPSSCPKQSHFGPNSSCPTFSPVARETVRFKLKI
jgi:hypothetical protein